jgi:hypothetical protein
VGVTEIFAFCVGSAASAGFCALRETVDCGCADRVTLSAPGAADGTPELGTFEGASLELSAGDAEALSICSAEARTADELADELSSFVSLSTGWFGSDGVAMDSSASSWLCEESF